VGEVGQDSRAEEPEARAGSGKNARAAPQRQQSQKQETRNRQDQFEMLKWHVAGNQDTRGNGSQGTDERVLQWKGDCSRRQDGRCQASRGLAHTGTNLNHGPDTHLPRPSEFGFRLSDVADRWPSPSVPPCRFFSLQPHSAATGAAITMRGGGPGGGARVDWIEVYGYPLERRAAQGSGRSR
jgi:hypothetical protein